MSKKTIQKDVSNGNIHDVRGMSNHFPHGGNSDQANKTPPMKILLAFSLDQRLATFNYYKAKQSQNSVPAINKVLYKPPCSPH